MAKKPKEEVTVEPAPAMPVADETAVDLNSNTNSSEHSAEEKEKLEKELSKDNVVARVITWTGNYLKVKFLKDGKLFTTYKGKNGSVQSAEKARDEALKSEEKAQS